MTKHVCKISRLNYGDCWESCKKC